MNTPHLLALSLLLASSWLAAETQIPPEAKADEQRSAKDLERDQTSKPQDIIPLLELEPGETVVDLLGGSGYYTELLASTVGPEGNAILHNNAAFAAFANDGLTLRLERLGTPSAFDVIVSETDELGFAPGSVDGFLLVMAYHDLYHEVPEYNWGPHDRKGVLAQLYQALKPDGRLVVIDHSGAQGTGISQTKSLHRMEKSTAINDITAAGFVLLKQPDTLQNPADDLTLNVFDPSIRGKTDRFVLVFGKSQEN
ncbi:methyltransferase domain-containing protein [Gilvimarinus agarilyticus]|uniref:methyltransferase domain-containing protein n=1 Tax=Gilvimarinus agarilyticus TaxID=679259 RepID=UPI0005A16EE6|nr:methyltransferase domain-containing protein [Gilvimarinus agarilyticus]